MTEEAKYYQMIYPDARKIRGEEIVKWAMDVAEDVKLGMPGSVEEAMFVLSNLGIANFAK